MTQDCTRYEKDTAVGKLKVVDRGRKRTLYLNGLPQTTIDTSDLSSTAADYIAYLHIGTLLCPEIENIGMLGLGGGAAVHSFHANYPEAKITAVDIDPDVVEVAKKHFFLNKYKNIDLVVDDARNFLMHRKDTFDFVILDVYDGEGYPDRLYTREAFNLISQALKSSDVYEQPVSALAVNVVGNLRGQNPRSRTVRTVIKTVKDVFPAVYLFAVQQSFWKRLFGRGNNYILLAHRRKKTLTDECLRSRAELRNQKAELNVDLSRMLKGRRSIPPLDEVQVLTDRAVRSHRRILSI